MSERIIVIVETIAVVILAIVVVIYAQVLWQRFQTSSLVQPEAVPADVSDDTDGNDITDAERMKVLEAISETSTNSVTPEERSRVLETLSEDQANIEVDTETRMQVLESLRGN